MKVDQRITECTGQGAYVERVVASGVFWLVLLVTAVGVFNVLDLYAVSNPFSQLVGRIANYLPNLIGGAALTLIVWLIASLLRALVSRALKSGTLDEKLSAKAGMRPGHNQSSDSRRLSTLL